MKKYLAVILLLPIALTAAMMGMWMAIVEDGSYPFGFTLAHAIGLAFIVATYIIASWLAIRYALDRSPDNEP